jgi:predicted MFS family arabinose efflux permease
MGPRFIRLMGLSGNIGNLRPLMAVYFIGQLGFAAFWSYVGIWGVHELGARPGQIGIMFVFDALAAAATGVLGGHLSDRIGRSRVFAFGMLAEGLVTVLLGFVGHHVLIGLALVVLAAAVGSPSITVRSAIVVDVVPEEQREEAFAAMRVVSNLCMVLGPPAAGLLLLGHNWTVLLLAIAGLGILSGVLSLILLPSNDRQEVQETEKTRAGGLVLSMLLKHPAFLLLLVSNLLGFVVYIAYDTVLPIVAVSNYRISPSVWGLLTVINPIIVVLFQIRLTKRISAVPPATKLAVAMALMGPPFLLLVVYSHIAMVVLVLALFVLGEMLWQPTVTALAASMAPQHARGSYLGIFSSSMSVAWTIGPLVSLQLLQLTSVAMVWVFFAAISVLGLLAGMLSCRAIERPTSNAPVTSP